MPDVRRLEVFLAVAREGSFSSAARKLGITQPAVSVHIEALEDEVGTRLCERLSRGVVLTEGGQALARYAREIVRLWQEAGAEVDSLTRVPRGPLRVAASTVPGEYILPGLLPLFRQRYPEVIVTLTVTDSGGVREMLLAQEADLGLCGVAPEDDRLEAQPFARDELVVVSPPGHPLRGEVALEELFRYPFVTREETSGTRAVLERALRQAGRDPGRLSLAAELGSPQAVKLAVQGGLGIAALSRWTVAGEISRGTLQTAAVAELRLQRPLYVVWRRGRTLRLAARCLRELLGEVTTGVLSPDANDQGGGLSG